MKKFKVILIVLIIICIVISVFPYILLNPTPKYNLKNEASLNQLKDDYLLNGEFITLNNYTSYIEDYNKSSANVITFVHGFGGSTFTFRNNIDYFVQKGFRVLLIDLKGFGLSEKTLNTSYYHKDQSLKIKEILDYLKINKTFLLGHSMGANVVTHFALEYSSYVKSLILVDGAIIENNIIAPSFLIGLHPVKGWANLLLTSLFTKDRFSEFLTSAYYNKSVVDNLVIDRYYLPLQFNEWQNSLIGIIRDSNNVIPKDLSNINLPTLIIWGSKDPWINVDNAYYLNQKIKNSKLAIINNVGHLPMEESPVEFNTEIFNFINL